MPLVTTFDQAVQYAARCIECPICKDVCKDPIRPKNCAHRYCVNCFRKCFQDKQEKVCATCRTPILSVSRRGYTEDEIFSAVAQAVPGIGGDDTDEEYDLQAMMMKAQMQSQILKNQAMQLREGAPSTSHRSSAPATRNSFVPRTSSAPRLSGEDGSTPHAQAQKMSRQPSSESPAAAARSERPDARASPGASVKAENSRGSFPFTHTGPAVPGRLTSHDGGAGKAPLPKDAARGHDEPPKKQVKFSGNLLAAKRSQPQSRPEASVHQPTHAPRPKPPTPKAASARPSIKDESVSPGRFATPVASPPRQLPKAPAACVDDEGLRLLHECRELRPNLSKALVEVNVQLMGTATSQVVLCPWDATLDTVASAIVERGYIPGPTGRVVHLCNGQEKDVTLVSAGAVAEMSTHSVFVRLI